jgi:hypothetical protein
MNSKGFLPLRMGSNHSVTRTNNGKLLFLEMEGEAHTAGQTQEAKWARDDSSAEVGERMLS